MNLQTNDATRRFPAAALAFGLMHAVVDATSIGVLVWGLRAAGPSVDGQIALLPDSVIWSRFLLYTLLAFGTQFPIGAIADRTQAYRGTLLLGFAMLAAAVPMGLVSAAAANAVAALGNAAFHVGGGALVLSGSTQKTAAAGVFVGPGAIGLALGVWLARSAGLAPWIYLAPLAVCAGVALAIRPVEFRRPAGEPRSLGSSGGVSAVCLTAIFLSIAIRSANGHGVWAIYEGNAPALWGLAVAACVGNMLGGFVADRLGWVATCALVLVVSAPLLSFFVDYAAVAILGMVLFQMTMPVTLTAVWRVFPGEAGLAFGLAALGVLAGVIPTYVCPTEWLTPRLLLLSLSVVSLVAILIGLPPIARLRDLAAAETEAGARGQGAVVGGQYITTPSRTHTTSR